MLKKSLAFAWLLLTTVTAQAQVEPFPANFQTKTIAANGVQLHVRVGGSGPAVLLIHGFGDTGDMWAPLAADLAKDHKVIAPDLRGMGLSSKPADNYDKWTRGCGYARGLGRPRRRQGSRGWA